MCMLRITMTTSETHLGQNEACEYEKGLYSLSPWHTPVEFAKAMHSDGNLHVRPVRRNPN